MPIVKTKQLTLKMLNELRYEGKLGTTILDGNNLYIKKTKTGLFWHYRVAFNANTGYKSTWLSLGSYPTLSIATARNKADKIRDLISQGINPKTAQAKLSDRLGKTLGEVLSIYQNTYYSGIKPNTKKIFNNTIKHLGSLHDVQIEAISEYDILDIADTIKRNGSPSVASYFVQFAKRLFSFAKQEGYLIENKTRDLKPSYTFKPKDNYLQPKQLAIFMTRLLDDQEITLTVKIAIYSLIVLMLRRSELVELEWSDVDLKSGRLVISRTKTINNFTMLIPTQILGAWRLLNRGFDRKSNAYRPLFNFSDNTLYRYITNLSIKYEVKRITPHDLRRTAMTLLAEQGNSYLVIDSALAHTVKGVNKSYLKSNLLEERGKLLQYYANYIDKVSNLDVLSELKNIHKNTIDSTKRSIT